VDNRYVVAPGSYHPTSGRRYEILRDAPIAEAPDWLVEWCLSQKNAEDEKTSVGVVGGKIPYGAHDTTLTRIGGKLRQDGLEEEAIYNSLVEVCEKRCQNYGPDYREMCRKIAKSVCRYEIKEVGSIVFPSAPALTPPEPVVSKAVPYPVFP